MKKIGLISGQGELPLAIARDARERGYHVVAAAIETLADKALANHADEIRWLNVGKLGELIRFFRKAGVTEAVMAGKVPKSVLYIGNLSPDLRAVKMLFSLKDRSDDSILLGITKELKKDGITLLKTTDFCRGLLAPEGVMTKKAPTDQEMKDITFGWKIAKEIGRLDIGQTVVVKDRAVMAIEAIEGTDEAIRRGGHLGGDGAVVIKVSKPQQDMRFDVPVIGIDTLRAMIEVKARVLAAEARKCIILGREELTNEADRHHIAIIGYQQTSPE